MVLQRHEKLQLIIILSSWIALSFVHYWLILVPLIFLVGLTVKMTGLLDICPLCLSFYGFELVAILFHVLGEPILPLWMVGVMVAYSAARGVEKLQQNIEDNNWGGGFEWVMLNYGALVCVLIIILGLQAI